MGYADYACGCGWASVGSFRSWSCSYHLAGNTTPEPKLQYSKAEVKQFRRWLRVNKKRLALERGV